MSKIYKTLNKWKKHPILVEKREVLKVLERYGFTIENKKGSHIIVSHKFLIDIPEFGANGEFTIPIKSGRKVKGVYLKRILLAIEIIEEMEEE